MPHLRAADWINLVAFLCFIALALPRPNLDEVKRRKIAAIGVGGIAITLFEAFILHRIVPPLAASIARDWTPYLLLLMFYWQAGLFVTRADTGVESKLLQIDQRVVAPPLEWCARSRAGNWILGYLELSYLLCYVSMPFALGALYLLRAGSHADFFWMVVLLATYPCYGLLAFLQTRPPRVLEEKWSVCLPCGKLRAFNLWILRHASIHANTFPSAHVASTTACALVLIHVGPIWVGLAFLWIAFSIALGAVAGRYHYAADAVLGMMVAAAAYIAVTRLN